MRITVLGGLLLCGWWLGTATALADPADESGGQALHSPLGGIAGGLVEAEVDEVVPAGAVPQSPAVPQPPQAPVPDVASQTVDRLPDPVAQPLAHAVPDLSASAPTDSEPTAQPAVPSARVAADQPAPPPVSPDADPLPMPVLPPPQVQAPALVAHPSLSSTADQLPASRLAESSTMLDERVTSGVPDSAPGTPNTSCPAGPTGAHPVAQAAPAATVSDTVAKADLALVARSPGAGAGGIPGCPSKQPSPSPD